VFSRVYAAGKIGRVGVLSSKGKIGRIGEKAGVVLSKFKNINLYVLPDPLRSTLKVAKY